MISSISYFLSLRGVSRIHSFLPNKNAAAHYDIAAPIKKAAAHQGAAHNKKTARNEQLYF